MKKTIIPIVPTIIATLCVLIMTALGIWQLDRKSQKEERLAQLEQRKDNHPFELDELLSKRPKIQDYPVVLTGDLLSDKVFYIDNRINNGKVGFDIIVPLQTAQGIILLNHGWVQSLGSREFLPTPELKNLLRYTGSVVYPTNNRMVQETNLHAGEFPVLLQQIDLDIMQDYLNMPVLDFIINLAPDTTSVFTRKWTPIVMSPEKHLGYAVQWFGLAIACLTIYLLSLIRLNQPSSQ